jgi:hypothetical protein
VNGWILESQLWVEDWAEWFWWPTLILPFHLHVQKAPCYLECKGVSKLSPVRISDWGLPGLVHLNLDEVPINFHLQPPVLIFILVLCLLTWAVKEENLVHTANIPYISMAGKTNCDRSWKHFLKNSWECLWVWINIIIKFTGNQCAFYKTSITDVSNVWFWKDFIIQLQFPLG